MRTRTLARADATVEAAWRALEPRLGSPTITCGWDWTASWIEHYGDVVEHRFVLAEDDGQAVGAALVTAQAGTPAWRPRTLHLGTAGEPHGTTVFVERNRLLAAPGDRDRFAAALGETLDGDGGWERLRLDGVLEEDAAALARWRAPAATRVDECPIADLAAGQEDVLAALPARRRQRVRQTLREFGSLEAEWADTTAAAHDVLDELIALHGGRWEAEGRTGAFADPRFTGFHRALVERLVPSGRAVLFRVRRGADTVGCLYGFIEGERLLFYQSGLRRFDDNRLRSGVAAHALLMQAAREHGLRAYDFLAPATRYKLELSTRTERLVWAEVERPGLRLRLERMARRVRAATRRERA